MNRTTIIREIAEDIREQMTDRTFLHVHGPNSMAMYVGAADRVLKRIEKRTNVTWEQLAQHYMPGERLVLGPETVINDAIGQGSLRTAEAVRESGFGKLR